MKSIDKKNTDLQASSPNDGCLETAREKAKVFWILAIIQATLIFTITLIAVPLPLIGHELGLSTALLVLVQAAYGLSYSGLLLFCGRLADRYGGLCMIRWGLSIFGIASLGAIMSADATQLVAMRFAQGVGAALTAPAALVLLRSLYPRASDFGLAMARWGGVSVLGATVGTVLSGIVSTYVSWRWMFSAPIAISLIALLLSGTKMNFEHRDSKVDRVALDLLGALMVTLGISVGSFGLIYSTELPWSNPMVIWPTLIGLGLVMYFVFYERKLDAPLFPPSFATHPKRALGLVGMMLAAAGMAIVTFLLSLFLQRQYGWSPMATSAAFIPYAIALLLMNKVAGIAIAKFSAYSVMIVGLLLSALGLTFLARISLAHNFLYALWVGIVLTPAGTSLVFSGSAVLSTLDVSPSQAGLAGGVMNTAMELGPTVGLAALMAVAATRTDLVLGYSWAFGATALSYGLLALLSLLVLAKQRLSDQSKETV
ncbi:MFS transporter [Pseudomonas sp. RA_105y_Pfl1_P41]|uniref:MFS transporter n=1 Tax=Pseudomonas sp. RA_105y_Pfl1_P41 TaxID=3088700 RepID=UPI0030DCC175